ncbi:TatD family hydrolase [bacterium]|nr:TatD family hydrolase [bacterium]
MDIFDPHIHMISRVTDDYERMALAGTRAVVEPAFWLGEPRTHAGSFFDYFRAISNFERQRAREHGIEHFCCIALNPREANDRPLAKEVIAGIEKFLDHEAVVAVGEVGFDDQTAAEEEAFHAQVELAKKKDLPVMVHTPHRQKLKGTLRSIAVLREHGIDPDRSLIDHNTEETIKAVRDAGMWAGHTVYPVTKLSPERAVNIVLEHGTDRMMINSSADWGKSDALSVSHCVVEMRKRGLDDAKIRKVVWENPVSFYSKSGRLKLNAR